MPKRFFEADRARVSFEKSVNFFIVKLKLFLLQLCPHARSINCHSNQLSFRAQNIKKLFAPGKEFPDSGFSLPLQMATWNLKLRVGCAEQFSRLIWVLCSVWRRQANRRARRRPPEGPTCVVRASQPPSKDPLVIVGIRGSTLISLSIYLFCCMCAARSHVCLESSGVHEPPQRLLWPQSQMKKFDFSLWHLSSCSFKLSADKPGSKSLADGLLLISKYEFFSPCGVFWLWNVIYFKMNRCASLEFLSKLEFFVYY